MNAVKGFGTLYMLFWGSGCGGIFNYQELEKIWGAICNLNKGGVDATTNFHQECWMFHVESSKFGFVWMTEPKNLLDYGQQKLLDSLVWHSDLRNCIFGLWSLGMRDRYRHIHPSMLLQRCLPCSATGRAEPLVWMCRGNILKNPPQLLVNSFSLAFKSLIIQI